MKVHLFKAFYSKTVVPHKTQNRLTFPLLSSLGNRSENKKYNYARGSPLNVFNNKSVLPTEVTKVNLARGPPT